MDFTSLIFLFLFLPAFILSWLITDPRYRFVILFTANILFITFGQVSSLLPIIGLTLIGYFIGRGIDTAQNKRIASVIMWFGLIVVLGLLFFQKYLLLASEETANTSYFYFSSIFPILGMSYIAFQVMSYIVDVKKGVVSYERNILKLILYIMFFPKLVAGPIVQYRLFKDQILMSNSAIDNVAAGLRRILAGVIKRLLLANQLGVVADAVFNLENPNFPPLYAWIGLAAYTLQIYYDFSGYTDIALGLCRTMGIELPENFNYPYTAQSVSDFWRRWHITLSVWFREYIFYPLERRRFKILGQQTNLLIVFLLTGLWHGLTLNFLIWGLIHGLAIAFESLDGGKWKVKIWRPLRHIYTLLLIMLGWVFFRSPTVEYAFGYIGRLLGNEEGIRPMAFSETTPFPFIEPSFLMVLIIAVLLSMPLSNILKSFPGWIEKQERFHGPYTQVLSDVILVTLFFLSVAAQVSGVFKPSIYAAF